MSRILFSTAILIAAGNPLIYAQCDASQAVRRIVEKASQIDITGLNRTEQLARRIPILEQGLKEYPHDYFILRRMMLAEDKQDEQIHWARSLQEKFPPQPT